MMNLARIGNKYLADEEPWKVIKNNPIRVETILKVALQITEKLALCSRVFLPKTADTLLNMLQIKCEDWEVAESLLISGNSIGTPTIIFEKITDEWVEHEKSKLITSPITNSKYPIMKELISFEDFTKMDLRIGHVIAAEKMENADKLLVLKVDTGIDERTIVSGIAKHYDAAAIIGKKVVVLMNLAPRKIRGVESHGMLLMAENSEGELSALISDRDFDFGVTIA
jgi:methionyl-tRNA synthetase